MVRAFLFGVVSLLAFLATAIGAGFDLIGNSAFGLTPDGFRLMAYISFGIFFSLTVWREVLLLFEPHPRVEFQGFSPATAGLVPQDIGSTGPRQGYFTRLIF